jgi:trk system potassium uptake protein TrkH
MRYITKKDLSTVGYHFGTLMIGIGISYLILIIVDIIYAINYSLAFIIPGLSSICMGLLLRKLKPIPNINLKHGMMISSLTWLWASFIGACTMILYLKNLYSINFPFIDAFLQSMSAWTTTGFSMFENMDSVHKPIRFLVCFEQWIGGLGLIALLMGLALNSGKTISELYKSEARNEKISPTIGNTLKKIIGVYVFLTIIGIISFKIAGMDGFDAICNTFTTISTGGMPIHSGSMGYYRTYGHDKYYLFNLISIIMMIIGATSFVTLYRVVKTRGLSFLRDIQFKFMISLILIFSILIYLVSTDTINRMNIVYDVVSAITTTGSSLEDSTTISHFSGFIKISLILLMIIGGSSGSTVGGLKLMRVIIILKGLYARIIEVLSPKGRVIKIKISNQEIDDSLLKEANNYFSFYMVVLLIGWLVLTSQGYDPINSLFDVVSAQGNVGLNTMVSPNMSDITKIMLIINMWVGRLEIIPVFVLIRSIFEILRSKTLKFNHH